MSGCANRGLIGVGSLGLIVCELRAIFYVSSQLLPRDDTLHTLGSPHEKILY